MKKISTLKLIALAAVLSCGGKAWAADFDLSGLNAADIRSSQADIKVPAAQMEADEVIGVDLSIRVPFKILKKAVTMAAASEKCLTIIDPAAPVVSKSGEFLKISNITVDANGIIVQPTLTLKPFLEGRDKLAIRIQKIQVHASMAPDAASSGARTTGSPIRADAGNGQAINQEQLMAQVMDVMIKSAYSALNAKLKVEHPMIKAEDILTLKYDKASWTLRATFSSKVLRELVPAGLVGDLHLTGFTFNDTGLVLKIQTDE